ncbi:MAG: SCO family protein [Chitinophagaceae bacterium]
MTAQKRKSFLILLAVSLAIGVPLLFYVIAKVMGKDKLEMPSYYREDVAIPNHKATELVKEGKILPVEDLVATNQFGDKISLNKDLAGRMLVVNFFFTTCTSTCPKLTQHLKILEYAFRRTPMARNDTTVQFISITVDPEHDTAEALRAYARKWKVDENHWWFLTGDKKMLYQWARSQFALHVPAGDGGADDFVHSNMLVLIDKDRFVRGYYNGLDTNAIGRCANDMGLLDMERKHH